MTSKSGAHALTNIASSRRLAYARAHPCNALRNDLSCAGIPTAYSLSCESGS